MAKCKNKYLLPLNKKEIYHWHEHSSPVHKEKLKYSLDMFVEKGTEVYAAQSGIVVWLKNNSKKHGIGKKYLNLGNRVVIKHKNNEPHVHFEVFNNPSKDESEGETLSVLFRIKRKGRCNPKCYR